MDNFFGVVGAIVVVMLSASLLCGVLAILAEVSGKVYDKWRHDIIYRRDAEIGEILKSGAHYLSDDPKTERMLRFLGDTIQGGYSVYAGHWRENWNMHWEREKAAALRGKEKSDGPL